MKYLYTNISLSIFSAYPVIKRKTEFKSSLTKTNCLGKLKAQEVNIFLENNLKVYRPYPRPKRLKKPTKKKKKKKNYFGLPFSLVSANITLEDFFFVCVCVYVCVCVCVCVCVNRSRDFQIYGTFNDTVSTKY